MPNNPNWGRWIAASVTNQFSEDFAESGYKIYVDGQILKESTSEKGQIDLRIDGPSYSREPSRGYFVLGGITINAHVQVYNSEDLWEERRISGLLEEWLGKDRCIYRHGTGIYDDLTFVGSLVYQARGRLDGVKTHHFGKEENDNIEQLSVEASYNMYLSLGD